MKRKQRKQPKRVQCWMVEWRGRCWFSRTYAGVEFYEDTGGTITPGYFVPDEPKAKAKAKVKR
jgi:hypothetical protein